MVQRLGQRRRRDLAASRSASTASCAARSSPAPRGRPSSGWSAACAPSSGRRHFVARYSLDALVGRSKELERVRALSRRYARTDGDGAHHRRERHRQGDGRAGDPRREPPARGALRRHQLRRLPRVAARVGAVRVRGGGLHRLAPRRAAGALRGGPHRHHLPRRGRGRPAHAPEPAAARAPGAAGPPAREQRPDADRRARPGGDAPRSPRGWCAAASSARTSTSASTSCRSTSRRCGSGGRTSASSPRSSSGARCCATGRPRRCGGRSARSSPAPRVRLARERPRAGERARAGGAPLRRPGGGPPPGGARAARGRPGDLRRRPGRPRGPTCAPRASHRTWPTCGASSRSATATPAGGQEARDLAVDPLPEAGDRPLSGGPSLQAAPSP